MPRCAQNGRYRFGSQPVGRYEPAAQSPPIVLQASKGLTTSPFLSCPKCCPSQQVWLHEDDTGVSPVETIKVMIEELLQSAVVNESIHLSLVLGDESNAVRVDTTAMPNGIVYTQVGEMA